MRATLNGLKHTLKQPHAAWKQLLKDVEPRLKDVEPRLKDVEPLLKDVGPRLKDVEKHEAACVQL